MKTRLRLLTIAAVYALLTPHTPMLHAQVLRAAEGIDIPDGTRKCIKPTRQPDKYTPGRGETFTPLACLVPVVNVSATSGTESESFVVVNPTNTNNLVAFSNLTTANSIFRAYSTNGGVTWTRGTIATNVACCDAQAAWDTFGNLFVVYINNSVNQINVILSTDGGITFSAPVTVGTGSVDQPSIAVGNGSVWVDWNSSGSMVARGAPVTGLGTWGPFNALQTIPSASGSFGGIAVGPGPNGGKVMVTYQNPTGGQGPATIFVNVDADGLGAGGFGAQITATTTNVGGFDFIPAQSGRSIDAEAGLVWDATGGPFNNRVYLVYTEETVAENNDTDIMVRTSINDGATWSAPVRVNNDPASPIRSQFLPYITLDRTSGTVAIGFHDCRNDNGVAGTGGTNAVANDDAEYYGTFSTDGGTTWAANTRLSGGFSNAAAAANGVDYGDYVGQAAHAGKLYSVWADNANCDGTNANGTLHQFDLYTNSLALAGSGFSVTTANPACSSIVTVQPSDFAVNLSDAVNPATVQASDFTVNGTPANSFVLSNGNTTITFHFNSSPVTQGQQTMHIAANAFTRASDSQGNLDFTCTFRYDATLLAVTTTNPPVGGSFTGPSTPTYDVNFNEAVDPASVQTTDLTLGGVAGSTVTGVTVINANTTARFTLNLTSAVSGTLTASIAAGAITDAFGNPNAAFTGNYSYTGNLCPTLSENFDGVVAPALPAGWTADVGVNVAGAPLWQTSTTTVDSAPNAAFTQDPANTCDNRIYTPTFTYTGSAQMSCRMNYDLEQSSATVAFDAGVLEISINGGAYNDIIAAGGSWVAGGYNHTSLSTGFNNPLLADRCPGGVCNNWSGVSTGGYVTTTVNMPPAGAGQPVKLRWRMGSDSSVSHAGWQVDNVVIYGPCTAPVATGAVSRKVHGGAGTFDIVLPLTGTPGVECRTGGATNDYSMVVTFNSNVTVTGSPQAQVTLGTGCIGTGGVCASGNNVTVSGATVTIPLTNVGNAQRINVTLTGVSNGSGTTNVVIPMSRLLGDTNNNGAVSATDVAQTKSQSGQTAGASNFRTDVNANGAISATDVAQVKAQSGTQLPP